jgi:dienelactone hydrolase
VHGRRRIATLLLHGDADPANPPGACQRLASLLAAEGPTRRIGYPGATYAWDQPQVGGSLSTEQPAPDVPDRIASAFWAELAELSAANAASFFLSTLRIGPGIGDGDRGPHHTREHRR